MKLTEQQRDVLRRESADYIRRGVIGNHWHLHHSIQAILREEERLRAEVRDLKARLRVVRVLLLEMGEQGLAADDVDWSCIRVTELGVKNWRKP